MTDGDKDNVPLKHFYKKDDNVIWMMSLILQVFISWERSFQGWGGLTKNVHLLDLRPDFGMTEDLRLLKISSSLIEVECILPKTAENVAPVSCGFFVFVFFGGDMYEDGHSLKRVSDHTSVPSPPALLKPRHSWTLSLVSHQCIFRSEVQLLVGVKGKRRTLHSS